MQKIYFIIACLFSVSYSLYSQDIDASFNPAENMLPKSPTAAALIQYQEFPANPYTGSGTFQIPLAQLSDNDLSVNLSLQYQAISHPVSQVVDRIGMNWKLNGGGMITRKMRGRPDDASIGQGFLTFRENFSYQDVQDWLTNKNVSQFNQLAGGCYDAQPDEFYFSMGTYSGTFAFTWDATTNGGKPVVVSKDDIQIKSFAKDSNGRITQWQLVDPMGMIYTFSELEITEVEAGINYGSCSSGLQQYVTGWYLTKMESPNIVGQSIDFSYENYTLDYNWQYVNTKTFRVYNVDATECGPFTSPNKFSIHGTILRSKRLSAITSSNNRFAVDFISTTPRTDTQGLLADSDFNRLDAIVIKGAIGNVLYRYDLDYSYQGRLLLKSIEKTGAMGTAIPKWEFDYYSGSFPPINSFSIDHRGHYNGVGSNTTFIPEYVYNVDGFGPVFFEGADRSPNPDFAQVGLLKTITQPTRGTIDLSYEGHEYSYINGTTVASKAEYEGQAANIPAIIVRGNDMGSNGFAENMTGIFDVITPLDSVLMEFFIDGQTYQTFNGAIFAPMAFLEDENGNEVLSFQFDIADINDPDFYPHIQSFRKRIFIPKGSYRLRVKVSTTPNQAGDDYDNLTMQVKFANISENDLVIRKDLSGVRIKHIIQRDETGKQATYRRFVYEDAVNTGYSSGSIYSEPKYASTSFNLVQDQENHDTVHECDYIDLIASSRIITGGTSGSYIGYRRIEEWIGENAEGGKVIHTFSSPATISDNLNLEKPFGPPTSNAYKTGLPQTTSYVSAMGDVIQQQIHNYIYPSLNIPSVAVSLGKVAPPAYRGRGAGHFQEISTYENYPFEDGKFAYSFRPFRLGYSLSDVTTNILDGVETITDLDYLASSDIAADYVHNNPTQTTTYNSNGDTHVTKTKYATEVNANPIDFREPAAITELVNRNMIDIPLEIQKEVNGVFQGGQRTEYALFTADDLVLPADYVQLLHTGDTLIRGRVIDYNTHGYATATIQRGYPRRTFNWDIASDLLQSVTYKDWTESFMWYGNNRKIQQQTAIDGQITKYYYDDLQRLNEIREREENVITQMIYEYGNQNNPLNSIQTSISFNDDTPPQTTIERLDGLGRPVQTLVNGERRNEVFYDNIGRIDKQTYLTGNFVTFDYDNSPLQRMVKERYPDGSFMETRYGKETIDGFDYFSTTLIDENRNQDMKLIDKIGRTYLTRQVTDTTAVTGLETLYDYDDRNNTTYIYSPKADKTSPTATPDLVFSYEYDARNRVENNYVPGMTVGTTIDNTYYPESDWLETVTDAAGDRIRLTYDEYGREDETFLRLNGQSVEIPLTDSDYDGDGIRSTGQLTSKVVTVLNENYTNPTLRIRLNHSYSYDTYGRVDVSIKDNYIGGTETMTNSYNLGDWLTGEQRVHTSNATYGNVNLSINHTFDHDVFGRVERCEYDIAGNQRTLYTQQWNSRDQLVNKTLGGNLQSIDYLYNERGWLRRINQPLDVFTSPTSPHGCQTSGFQPPMDNEEVMEMTFCGEVTANVEELLGVRFNPNINVDCYNPCATSSFFMGTPTCTSFASQPSTKNGAQTRYTTSVEIPCPGGTETQLRPNINSFPMEGDTLYRILRCDGKEYYCWFEDLPTNEDYVELQKIFVSSPQQLFAVNDGCCGETQTVNVSGLILAVGQDAENISIENYTLKDGPCDAKPPDCTALEQEEQEDYIADLIANPLTVDNVSYPFYLVRVKLCGGREVHLTPNELRELPHAYIELQRTYIGTPEQDFQVGLQTSNLDTADLFYQSLHYNEENAPITGVEAQKNGNISYQTWQVKGSNEQYYRYSYDQLDRIKNAIYGERSGMDWEQTNLYNATFLGYDANGNIGKIFRSGPEINPVSGMLNYGCSTQIDNLTLSYSGNRIMDVRDNAFNDNRKRGFFAEDNTLAVYEYDTKGNLTKTLNKDLTIAYNYLNLPHSFTFDENTVDTASIEIIYTAEGEKLRKVANSDNTDQQEKEYCNGIEYENADLATVYNDAGRAVYDSSDDSWSFQWMIRDHLGNMRVMFREDVLADTLEILQQEHYYPFGGSHEGKWNEQQPDVAQDYKYNNKEQNSEFGLDWMDYGNRWHMTWIPQFSAIDRFAEKYTAFSPYHYGVNNPIKYVDIQGDSIKTYFFDESGNQTSAIPAQVQQSFNNEYGIQLGYNTETNMLYKAGDVETSNEVGTQGKAEIETALGEGVASTELAIGYNLGYKRSAAGETYSVVYGEHIGDAGAGIALIDLADFNGNGSLKGTSANIQFNSRSMNLARSFEHEFFGHGIKGIGGGRYETETPYWLKGLPIGGNVGYINQAFRGGTIPYRIGYGGKQDQFANGGILKYRSQRSLEKTKKTIMGRKYF